MLQSLTEMQQELKVQQNNKRVAEAAAAAIGEQRAQAVAEYRRNLFDELGRMVQKENGLAETLVKAEQKAKLQALRAPVDGTVQQLAVHTVGGVVTPSQELMVVVPANSRLEIEANITNRDIGFIQAGQEAEIKVDTFNFTKYGLVHGRVLSLSQDSIKRQKPTDPGKEKSAGATTDTSEPLGQEMVYQARVSLDQTDMVVDGKRVPLSPGMAVTAEIKTGARSVLSYLLSPILRFHQESMRER
jgi:hemolysin D